MNYLLQNSISNNGKDCKIYNYNDIEAILRKIGVPNYVYDNKKIKYINSANAFDIETTSFKVQSTEQKRALMYEWTISLSGLIIIGRTWEEFIELTNRIAEFYETNSDKRLVIYIHNLAYEFQFIKKLFKWEEVFALKKRKPVRALTDSGIEFRCSYLLSGYRLEKLAEQLQEYKVTKLVDNLDYQVIRNSKTILSEEEINYCVNDVLVVTAYIQELIERLNGIHNIPNTKTGFVRQYCRKYCLYGGEGKRDSDTFNSYRKLMKNLTLTPYIYMLLKDCFQGGFTHANAVYSNIVLNNVHSFDFTSSYPYVMCSEKFPMTKFKRVSIQSTEQFNKYINTFACIFELELTGVRSKEYFENYISYSHCREVRKAQLNNGRIVKAEHLKISITEQDYFIIKDMYEWDSASIYNFHYAIKKYLPKNFILAILNLYETKTKLKDVLGKEVEYMNSKENINACFGMIVTDILRALIKYGDDWTEEIPDITEAIDKNNKSVKRFLYYAWGIYVTAYARRNLFSGILEFKDDYVYSDTDSIKVLNAEAHMEYINKYNEEAIEKLKNMCEYYDIDFNKTRPSNIKGKVKQLGIWDSEGVYSRFKTLGAKRYMIEKNGEVSLTVSGINKRKAIPYLLKEYGEDMIFDIFAEGLHVDAKYTGKLTHTYCDEEIQGFITDYQGNQAYYHEMSYIHLEPAPYDLSLNDQYVDYILNIQEEIYK